MVNIHNVTAAIQDAPYPQRLIEALGRLQAQNIHIVPYRLCIYDLIEQHTLYASRSVAEMLGYTVEETHALSTDGLANLIHSDDLGRVADHYQQIATLHYGEAIAIQYRMRRASGSWCWLHSQETPLVQAADGFPLQVLGLLQDVTPLSIFKSQGEPLARRLFRQQSANQAIANHN